MVPQSHILQLYNTRCATAPTLELLKFPTVSVTVTQRTAGQDAFDGSASHANTKRANRYVCAAHCDSDLSGSSDAHIVMSPLVVQQLTSLDCMT